MTTTVPRRKARKAAVELPVLGLGTYRTFDSTDLGQLGQVLDTALAVGADLVDTAPVYNRSETTLAALLRPGRPFFVATKVWDSDPESVEATFQRQLRDYGRSSIDLLQVHNLNGWAANLTWLDQQKAAGRVGATGVTYQFDEAFGLGGTRADLLRIIEDDLVDFVQINLNAAEADLAADVLPAAAERGIGVLVMRPFGQGELFASAPPADWLHDLGCADWSEALLRWNLSHPEVTSVLAATSSPEHMRRNAIAVAKGPLGDDEAAEVARCATSLRSRGTWRNY